MNTSKALKIAEKEDAILHLLLRYGYLYQGQIAVALAPLLGLESIECCISEVSRTLKRLKEKKLVDTGKRTKMGEPYAATTLAADQRDYEGHRKIDVLRAVSEHRDICNDMCIRWELESSKKAFTEREIHRGLRKNEDETGLGCKPLYGKIPDSILVYTDREGYSGEGRELKAWAEIENSIRTTSSVENLAVWLTKVAGPYGDEKDPEFCEVIFILTDKVPYNSFVPRLKKRLKKALEGKPQRIFDDTWSRVTIWRITKESQKAQIQVCE